MLAWLTYVHAGLCTEGRCASQDVLVRRRGSCHADSEPKTFGAVMEVKELWVTVAAFFALVHGTTVDCNARVFLVVVAMVFRSDAETSCRSQWNDSRCRHVFQDR